MTDANTRSSQVRDEVRALLADLDSVKERHLWMAVTAEERVQAIVYAVRHGPHSEGKRYLIERAGKALKWRPQKVEENIHKLAPQLERATGVLDGFEGHLLFSLWSDTGIWKIFAELYASTASVAGQADQPTPDLGKIEPAIYQALGIASLDTVLVFLISFATYSNPWRDVLHPWLRSLDDEGLAALLDRATAYNQTEVSTESSPDPDSGSRVDEAFPEFGDAAHETPPDLGRLGELEQQLDHLRSQFDDLSSWMQTVSVEMRELGTPPPANLAVQIDSVVTAFERMRDSALAERSSIFGHGGTHVDLPSLIRIGTVLAECRTEVDRIRQQQDVQEQAQATLHLAGRLTSPHSSLVSTLAACRTAAGDLLSEVKDLSVDRSEVIEGLATGRHPFALLVKRVTEGELSVDDDMLLDVWLRERFGPALAIAVLSGRVKIGPEPVDYAAGHAAFIQGEDESEEEVTANPTPGDDGEEQGRVDLLANPDSAAGTAPWP
ncbi:MAG TPA: hypothetical protein VF263_14395, partial [Longimicrobiaceae bacterium]